MVTRRPSSPLNNLAATPPSGIGEAAGPDVPEWTLSTDDGKVHRFRDLNTLQKWIVERKVSRTDRISRVGGPWLALQDVVELTPFFNVVDEADRARASTGLPGGMPTAPAFPSPSGGWPSGQAPRTASEPLRAGDSGRAGGTPPPIPIAARRGISEDGPTVPNRRLPAEGAELWGAVPGPASASMSMATPQVGRGDLLTPRPAVVPTPEPPARRRTPDGQSATGAVGRASSSPALAATQEGIRRPGASAPRLAFDHSITAEAHPLESDLSVPGHGAKVPVALAIVLLAVASGGYWWWRVQAARGSALPAQPAAIGSAGAAATNSRPSSEGQGLVVPAGRVPSGANQANPAGPANSASPERSDHAAPASTASRGAAANAGRANAGDSKRARSGAIEGPTHVGRHPGDVSSDRDSEASASAGAGSSYDRLVTEADRLLGRGKSAKADKMYAQALAIQPDGVSALTGAAYVLLDRQRHLKAIETFRRALAIQPTFGPALFGVAESYRARGDTAQALGAYRQYLTIAPAGDDAPAARRQIKDLESAGAAAPAAGDGSPRRQTPEPAVEAPTND